MKYSKLIFFFLFFFLLSKTHGQKPIIDEHAYADWETTLGFHNVISNDGKYIVYDIQDPKNKKLIIYGTNGNWKREIKDFKDSPVISDNSRLLLVKIKGDSVAKVALGSTAIQYIANVSSFSFLKSKTDQWIVYWFKDNSKKVVLENLTTGKQRHFNDVISISSNKSGTLAVLKNKPGEHGEIQKEIIWADLKNEKLKRLIWHGEKADNLVFDSNRNQFSFMSGDSILYYREGMEKPISLLKKEPVAFNDGLKLGFISKFSKNGRSLFITLIKEKVSHAENGGVEVWSYRDLKLKSLNNRLGAQDYLAVVDIGNDKVIRLEYENEKIMFPEFEGSPDSNLVIRYHDRNVSDDESGWNFKGKSALSLVSIKSGKRKHLDIEHYISLTPNGKYFIGYDIKQQTYFSYEVTTNIKRNITSNIQTSWLGLADPSNPGGNRGIAGWLKNGENLLIYDRYDIWKIDPSCKQKPINLTNSYGQKHNIVFNLSLLDESTRELAENERLILSAFNVITKDNGFFTKKINEKGNPELLTMGSYIYSTNSQFTPSGANFNPVKASQAETYLIRRTSATEAPNFFYTNNFKKFTPLTDFHPEKKYNWYTTELHNWKSLDGQSLQGILYKPENFDPNKKYPVIFYYYERLSDGLNAYIKPKPLCEGCNIDIPTYVSQGYLVFSPDIYYKIGDPMQGTYDAVVSAANYVSTLPFVNAKKMGIQGCSFGGFQTNYLVTHTGLFAAAVSSSGIANLTSGAGSLDDSGRSSQSFYAYGQIRMGGNLWEKTESYIKNSPIFYVDKITTPLLLMHTKEDGICLYPNIIEFFLGLRRLGKKAWMLAYPNEDHGLSKKENVKDFSKRMMQFFDHYLKDKPAPIWMTREISESNRKLYGDLEYDREIKTPGPGLLTVGEQRKLDSIMTRKPILIELK